MARIAGVDIPRKKKIGIAVTSIFGIGRSNGLDILNKANVNPDIRVRNLTEEEVGRIREIVDLEDIEEVRRLPHLKLTRRCANGKNERR